MRPRMEPGNLITVLFGLCFVAAGIYLYAYMGRFLDTAREASGLVIEVVYAEGRQKSRMHPVVRFTTHEGREAVGRSWQHHNSQVGDKVELLYDPAAPEHVEIGTLSQLRKQRMLFTSLCLVFGLVVCGIGIGLELGLLKWRPTAYRR